MGKFLGTMMLFVAPFISQGCSTLSKTANSQGPIAHATLNTAPPRVRDHTRAGCPPELLARAGALLPGRDCDVRDHGFRWSSKHLIRFLTDSAEQIVFMEKHGDYVQVNSKDTVEALNEILQEYKFSRSSFEDILKVSSFLSVLVNLYADSPYGFVGSSLFVKWTEETQARHGGTEDWLEGTEKDTTVFWDLCRDPVFVFRDNAWTVVFNVFKAAGGVDQWRVAGRFHPEAERNSISAIDIANIKPKGTFSPIMAR